MPSSVNLPAAQVQAVVGAASHQTLMGSGNMAHINLYNAYVRVSSELDAKK